MLHDLEDAAPIDSFNILVVQEFALFGSELIVFFSPAFLIFEQFERTREDLSAERALIVKMPLLDLFLMALEVVILDFVLIILGLDVNLPACFTH